MVRIAFAVLLALLGLMYLVDFALRAFVQGVQGDQAPALILGVLCLAGGAHLWLTRRSQDQPPAADDSQPRTTFRDPVAAYNSVNNVEAHLVCGLLQNAGVPAKVIEDVSQVGVWWGGTVAEIHKPQVWIERDDVERARPILTEYDRRNAGRRTVQPEAGPPIEVVCEECGKRSVFPKSQNGTTQNCPHCQAYVDVGGETESGESDDANGEEP
jgi:hypothetical protein